jgi:hypothetical protein
MKWRQETPQLGLLIDPKSDTSVSKVVQQDLKSDSSVFKVVQQDPKSESSVSRVVQQLPYWIQTLQGSKIIL